MKGKKGLINTSLYLINENLPEVENIYLRSASTCSGINPKFESILFVPMILGMRLKVM